MAEIKRAKDQVSTSHAVLPCALGRLPAWWQPPVRRVVLPVATFVNRA